MSRSATKSRPKRTRQRAKPATRAELTDAHLAEIATVIDHKFKDRSLLDRAFTHASALSGANRGLASNQRLEFLGDRVLGLVIAERLFTRRTQEREGDLAPRLNRLVNKSACAEAMRHMQLGQYLIMSANEISGGGRERDSTLGDLCEAVIGALYLDSGITKSRKFIERAFAPQFEAMKADSKDPKSRLQEWAQGRGQALPKYKTIARHGPDHAPTFVVEVEVGRGLTAEGKARSKQAAEREAAEALLLDVKARNEY
ncbi:MAG: ribonuclease III [Pseudomonadota bacterium]